MRTQKRRESYMPWQVRRAVYARRGYYCATCGTRLRLSIHHVIPISEGGSRIDTDNMIVLCLDHHRALHKLGQPGDESALTDRGNHAPPSSRPRNSTDTRPSSTTADPVGLPDPDSPARLAARLGELTRDPAEALFRDAIDKNIEILGGSRAACDGGEQE